MKSNKIILFFIVLAFFGNGYTQELTKKFNLTWRTSSEFAVISSKSKTTIKIPTIKDNGFDKHYLPTYNDTWKISKNLKIGSYKIKNIVYKVISKDVFHKESQLFFPTKLKHQFKIKNDRDNSFATILMTPLILDGTILKKVISFELVYHLTPKSQKREFSTIHNSPLATGNWYKFAIDTTGVYKLSRSFLSSLGFNTNVNPKKIKIYGNGGNMLNELNGDFRYDDLQENAIYFNGEDDESFDNNDYILFYAQGPDIWKHNVATNKATHQTNIYSDKAYYYVTFSDNFGKRIPTIPEIIGASNLTVTTSNDSMLHELEKFNFGSLGQEFYGESFQIEDTQNFTFNFTDLDITQPITVTMKTASSASCKFSLEYNSQPILESNIADPSNYWVGRSISGSTTLTAINELLDFKVILTNNAPSTKAYLDYLEINGIKNLIARDKQFTFRNYQVAQQSGIATFQIQNNQNIFKIWDVTDSINVSNITNQATDNTFSFNTNAGSLKEYLLVNENDYYAPEKLSATHVENQNLHALKDIDYLIITTNELKNEAQRLADYHEQNSGFTTLILDPETIYEEFSSGSQDVTAIRDFIRHLYENATTPAQRIKYVLFLGDTSFDFKNIEGNNGTINIPAFQSVASLDTVLSFVTDDFFGMMDDNEGAFSRTNSGDRLDVATGRIPVKSISEAKTAIDRTLNYYSKEAFGKWRNHVSMVTDDIDSGNNAGTNYTLELKTEEIADNIQNYKPIYNVSKIYADAYVQQLNAGGERYPDVKTAITNAVERGSLILNYFGHGGENGFASERFLDVPQVQNWYNKNTLPLFITITCEFSKFDNPSRNTAGEYLFSNPNGGSVNMITTTRKVYIGFGGNFNLDLISNLLEFTDNDDLTIAEALAKTKNQNSGHTQRLFIYFFGDPAMKLPIAKSNILITEMNDIPAGQQFEPIKALSHVYFKGIVTDNNDNLLPTFNGELFVTVYDKSVDRVTLNNDNQIVEISDPNNPPPATINIPAIMEFDARESKIFNGKASVTNGQWEFDFIAPRDIRIAYGSAKLSFYAENQIIDKAGYSTDVIIGGINDDAPNDDVGPTIRLYMNDESFVDGGNTNESPLFLAYLEDDSGINTSLTAVDHDIVGILDDDDANPIIMNDFYETELNDFTKGIVKFPFRDLSVGLHTIRFKCWDTYNNSSEATLNFVVVNDDDLVLDHVLNYPNPFINYTEFWFNHNKPNESLEAQVQIFTISGKLIKTINQTILADGTQHVRSLVWNGLDDFGNKIGKGVYIYKLNVKTISSGLSSEKVEKLVILQ